MSNSLTEPSEALQEVGEIIRLHRKRKRLTQAQLGTEIDLDASAVCRIEQGKRPNLNATTLARIASVLGIDRDRVLAPLEGGDLEAVAWLDQLATFMTAPRSLGAQRTDEPSFPLRSSSATREPNPAAGAGRGSAPTSPEAA